MKSIFVSVTRSIVFGVLFYACVVPHPFYRPPVKELNLADRYLAEFLSVDVKTCAQKHESFVVKATDEALVGVDRNGAPMTAPAAFTSWGIRSTKADFFIVQFRPGPKQTYRIDVTAFNGSRVLFTIVLLYFVVLLLFSCFLYI